MHAFTITVADGDAFEHTFTSTVVVVAATALDAQLLATQLVLTPMPGKPEHMQILEVTPQ
jgi:hypothetical protein